MGLGGESVKGVEGRGESLGGGGGRGVTESVGGGWGGAGRVSRGRGRAGRVSQWGRGESVCVCVWGGGSVSGWVGEVSQWGAGAERVSWRLWSGESVGGDGVVVVGRRRESVGGWGGFHLSQCGCRGEESVSGGVEGGASRGGGGRGRGRGQSVSGGRGGRES